MRSRFLGPLAMLSPGGGVKLNLSFPFLHPQFLQNAIATAPPARLQRGPRAAVGVGTRQAVQRMLSRASGRQVGMREYKGHHFPQPGSSQRGSWAHYLGVAVYVFILATRVVSRSNMPDCFLWFSVSSRWHYPVGGTPHGTIPMAWFLWGSSGGLSSIALPLAPRVIPFEHCAPFALTVLKNV